MPLLNIPRINEQQAWPTIVISNAERQAIAAPSPTPVPGKTRKTSPLKASAPPVTGAAPAGLPGTAAATTAANQARPSRSGGSAVWGWFSAFPKGAFIGIVLFALFYGFIANRVFWLADWHWAYLAGGVTLGAILIRFDRTLIVLTAVGMWYSRAVLLDSPEMILIWIAGGILGRLIYEALP